jgi:hypothetical protein
VGQLNVDRKFDPILIVESTTIFRNFCRLCKNCRFVDQKIGILTVKKGYLIQNQVLMVSLL